MKHHIFHFSGLLLGLALFPSLSSSADQPTCDTSTRPASACVEGQLNTYACSVSKSCSSTDVTRKLFNVGTTYNWVMTRNGTPSTVDICKTMPTLAAGDHFYILADVVNSGWIKYRYFVYEFTKGTKETISYDPGWRKRNVNSAVYDGGCKVDITNRYKGANTDYGYTFLTVVEVWKMPAANVGMCRSQIVNNDIARSFWEKPGGALLSLGVCASGEINDKYINGSLYGKIVSIKQTPKKNNDFFYINICDQLWMTVADLDQKKIAWDSFYIMAHLTNGWWIPMPYPVNQFTFGGNPRWQEYYLNDGKDHHYETKYDGQCNLGIRVFYDGNKTDSGPAYISYYELGFTKDAKCYSSLLDLQYITYLPKILKSIPYDIRTNAPFIASLGACLNESGCTISTAWTNSFTNDCGCGDNATDYLPSETQFKVNSNTGFCIFGNVLIAPLFPAVNSSTSWECRGTGATTSCTAHRLDYVPVSGDCGSLVSVLDNITVTSATSWLCDVGAVSNLRRYVGWWEWQCLGTDGWTSASCRAERSPSPISQTDCTAPKTKTGSPSIFIKAFPLCGSAASTSVDLPNHLLSNRLDTCLVGSLTGWIQTSSGAVYSWTCQNASQSTTCTARRNPLTPDFTWWCQSRTCR